MPIHPWGAPRHDTEQQLRLAAHDFGQITVNGLPGDPPYVQPCRYPRRRSC
jgi:transcriptional regulator